MIVTYDPYSGTLGRFSRAEVIKMVADAGYEGLNLPVREPFVKAEDAGDVDELIGLLAPAAEPSGRAGPRPRRAHAERGRSPRNRPPATEVRRVWSACRPVSADAPVASFLRRRGLNAAVVEDRDLVRALPHGLPVPPWARLGRQRWTDGWRCILPAYGPTGVLESLRARWIGPGCPPFGPKSLAPRAGPGSAAGLVLADGLGRLTLQHGARPDILPAGAPLVLVVTEGEPDYLTWATRWADSAGEAPGVLGVWSGSWSAKIGERVAAAADLVVVRTHRDEKGDRYAAEIRASLPAHIRVLRGGQDG